ncbi:uncharacterized protein LOC114842563 [Betta splendens]|uniref:Uncharacterized protein LOC114842563 n=1 Tax=Betta splendens TaxID=158456 RepID=A0A6P7KNF6_BETSP|nr:uncharacterized protein LOC114842563 [Betta splendens]
MQKTHLDSERSTHAGMEVQARSSHKYLLLQVWCGLLTVTMVVMAALLVSIKSKSTEEVSRLRPDNPTAHPTVMPSATRLKSVGSSLSYIQLIKSQNNSWEVTPEYKLCSLLLRNNSISCMEDSLYFIYAQVTFSKFSKSNLNKYVTLRRNPRPGKEGRKLVEGVFPSTTDSSVWVAKVVKLQKEDVVSLEITDDCLNENTFWGAYQL